MRTQGILRFLVPALTGLALSIAPIATAGDQPGEAITVTGFVSGHSYQGADAAIESVIIWDADKGGWIVTPTGKGAELLKAVGSEVTVKGVIQKYDDNGRETVAVNVAEYEILWDAVEKAPGDAIKVSGVVRKHGGSGPAIINDWILIPEGKGLEVLQSAIGAKLAVSGVVEKYDDNGRKTVAVRVGGFERVN